MKWWVNRKHGCIDRLTVKGVRGNLVDLFGFNEYVGWEENQDKVHYRQTESEKLEVKDTSSGIHVEGVIGAQRFSTVYSRVGQKLVVRVDREYLDDVSRVYDDSICFICRRGWYDRFEIFTPTSKYFGWWESDPYTMDNVVGVDWDPTKPRRGQNLFAEACAGGWGKVLGGDSGLEFSVCSFSGGCRPQFHIVEFPSREHVEFEFTFDTYIVRRNKGDKQMLELLIQEVRE